MAAAASKKKHRSRAPRLSEAEIKSKEARFFALVHLVGRICTQVCISGTIIACVYFGVYLPIKVSHGEATSITFILQWFADISLNVVLAWTTAGGLGLLAHRERKKRLREREERDKRIEELESLIDPGRTSSGLTVDGAMAKEK